MSYDADGNFIVDGSVFDPDDDYLDIEDWEDAGYSIEEPNLDDLEDDDTILGEEELWAEE